MSADEPVVLHADHGDGVHVLTVNRPKALNALNAAVIEGLIAQVDALGDAPRALILAGAGKAFVAGADIAAMAELTVLEAEAFAARGQALAARLVGAPYPTIAAVHGYALGGGCELALSCDIILAGPRAVFGQPEVKLGVIPGFGGTQRLARRVGMGRALDLCLTARNVKADEALAMGLASRLVDGDVVEAAVALGKEIAALGPVAVRLAKRAIHEGFDADLDKALAAERTLFATCFSTHDQREGMAAFLGRRPAEFTGA